MALSGYSITGETSEQALFAFVGEGENGKTTAIEGIKTTIGDDYFTPAPPDLLTVSNTDRHPTELAALHGRRLIVAAESREGRKLRETLVKLLTGGDTISARRMREDFWSYKPEFKLILYTNHRPQITGTDHAIWRRIQLLMFSQKFSGRRKDKKLPSKLAAEATGILAWLVRGCLDWQQHGLGIPASVAAATKQYKRSQDVVGQFIEERCVTGSQFDITFQSLYDEMKRWADTNGEDLPTKTTAGAYLVAHGFERGQRSNMRTYHGLKLRGRT